MFPFLRSKKLAENEFTGTYPIKEEQLINEVIRKNRLVLEDVIDWCPASIFQGSYFNYGIPDFLKPIINLPIGDTKTYSDVVCYYARFFRKVNYLELGVSVGKNFFQLANHFQSSNLTGFDVENINPVLESKFENISTSEWETKKDSIRKETSKFTNYKYKNNTVGYLAGDIWDENSWERLNGNRFNIIFSDALHDPKALLWEYKMIKKFNLLDNPFIFIWDDLNHGLEESFYEIAKDLKRRFKLSKQQIILGKINGWCGVNEQLHDVGIVSSLQLQ